MGLMQRIVDAVIGEKPTVKAMDIERPLSGMYGENVWTIGYTGEKNTGELGPAIDYRPNYPILRVRSWQSYMESEITKTVVDRYATWVIGSGLKLQCAPDMLVLNSEGVSMDKTARENFNEITEARYRVWAASNASDWFGMASLNRIEKRAYRAAKVGGDVLVILRYVKGRVKVQLVDGQNVTTPLDRLTDPKVRHGVEVDENGKHVAYYVRKSGIAPTWERVPAFGPKSKQKMAFLVYGSEFRIDSVRGMPLIATVLETLKKLDRYKEATVGSAEERQKIVYQIVHDLNATGENPLLANLATALDADADGAGLPTDEAGTKLARTVAVMTQKQTFNMSQGSELKSLESKNELTFKEFYDTNFDIVCAAVGIPPNVARMLYTDSFSASRAALKDWEHSLRVERKDFSDQFNANVYRFWLWTEILAQKVQAQGYINALAQDNDTIIDAYTSAKWIGANVPHIDPLKEVKAEREKLGELGKAIPLTTVEDATEALSCGDSDANMEQFGEELNYAKSLNLVAPVATVAVAGSRSQTPE
jgi:capsid protein